MSLIEVKGLKKSFGSLDVLKGLDLSVEQGERIAIIGGSGCGKSVFLRSLCLLEKPDEGQVLIDGQEITAKGARVDEIRRSMGMSSDSLYITADMPEGTIITEPCFSDAFVPVELSPGKQQ